MNKKSNNGGKSLGLCGTLAVIFIVLKLCNLINWSWWWVLAPIWIPLCLIVFFGFLAYVLKDDDDEK